MSKLIKIAVDAMGGDNSPKKIIDGIIHNHKINQEIESKNHDLHKEPPVFTQVETSKKGDEKEDWWLLSND